MENNSSYLVWPAVFMLALALSGCSGGGGGDSDGASAGNNSGGQSVNSDSFLSRVNAIIGNNSDTAEPESIESIEVTTPENREPASIS